MNYFIAIAFLIILSFSNHLPALGDTEKTVTRINGSVDGRKSNDAAWTPIFASRPLTNGDWARTHSDSLAKIYLEGGHHFVKLYENTLVEMSKVEGEGTNRFIQLKQTLGQIKVNFDKYLGKSQKMEVKTPTATLAVRGTSFLSLVLPSGHTIVQVLTGAVRVTPVSGMPFQIHAGNGAVIRPYTGQAPSSTVYKSISGNNVSSSSLINDQITYTAHGGETTDTVASGETKTAGTTTEGTTLTDPHLTSTDTAVSSTATQTLTNTVDTLSASFKHSFSNMFGNAAGNTQLYDFSFKQKFSASNLEGAITVNINKPSLNPNNFGIFLPFSATFYPATGTSAPSPNIDSTKSTVSGTISYSATGITPNDTFTLIVKGDAQVKLSDPTQPFAAYFKLNPANLSGIYDPNGTVDIGGNIADPQTAQSNPNILGKGDSSVRAILLRISHPYSLPINCFGQSH